MRLSLATFAILLAGCGAKMGDMPGCPDGQVTDPVTMACVECVPGENSCPQGDYCTGQGTCAPGCQTENDCGAGEGCCDHVCTDTNSNPSSCGTCGHACGAGDGCCEGTCTELSSLTDCGACGNTCATGDFCDGTQCNTPTFPSFCQNNTVYEIYDGIAADEAAADEMASTITANCPATVVVHTAPQTDATLVDQATGQPLGGSGVTYVLGGGPFPNKPLRWLERTQEITKVFFDAPDGVNYYWKLRADASQVAMMPASQCNAHADQFVTELVTDPMSGTLSLIGYGACSGGKGTEAAAWFYAHALLPNRANYPDSWYVFSWSDTNNDGAPNLGDTFTVLAHGL